MLEILYSNSLIGKKEENQDASMVKKFPNGDRLLAVADGMGGGVMGAELALHTMKFLDTFFKEETIYPLQKLKQALLMLSDELIGMLDGQKGGTTLCVVYYRQGEIFYINIGDSRVWLCRELLESEALAPNSARLKPSAPSVTRGLLNLTLDQNLYEYNRLKKIYTDDEEKRFVHQILGISTSFEIEETLKDERWSAFGSFLLQPNDILILSTDGFHDHIERDGFCEDFNENFENILVGVQERSHDNITVITAKEI